MLPAIAAVTDACGSVRSSLRTSIHHPAVLANRAATIDHISNGRLVLGIGAGWQINEHHAYGIELEPPVTRVDRFEEAIEIVRSLFDERAHRLRRRRTTRSPTRRCDPKPVQSPLPILVGTASPRMLRITATHADEWNTWGAPELARRRRREVRSRRANASVATRRRCARRRRRWCSSPTTPTSVDEGPRRRRWPRARSSDRSSEIVDEVGELRRARLRRVHRPRLRRSPAIATRATASSSKSVDALTARSRLITLRADDRDRSHRRSRARRERSLGVGRPSARRRRCGTWRGSPRPPRRAGSVSACSSSSDAFFTALTPPIAFTSFFLRASPSRGCRRASSSSSACRAARGGTCWRSGAPRRGCAAA